jgi:hypothetical protein
MNAVTVIRSRGAIPRIDESGHLALDLSQVPHDQRPEVVALARQHKDAIVRELTGGPTGSPLPMPEHLADALLSCGYVTPEWTPAGCRAFLADLMREWPGFEVVGWYGCRFPECWPAHLMDAVQSVYVMSIQGGGVTPEEANS